MSTRFTVINDPFVCEVCGHKNPPADKTCRNHCRKCLSSKHVDTFPGDRAETCHGVLQPIGVEFKRGEMDSLVFVCKKCGKKGRNKIAVDDDREAIFAVMSAQKPLI